MNGNTPRRSDYRRWRHRPCIARALSKYECRTVLLEKEEDVCSGTSKATGTIVHANCDAKTGSLKAKLNVKATP